MNNIAILIPSLRKGGAEKQAVLLKKALKQSGFNVTFVLFNGELGYNEELKTLGEFTSSDLIILQGNIVKKLYNLIRFLKNKEIDVLFSYLTAPNFFGGIAAKISGIDYFYTGIRNAFLEKYKLYFEYIASRLATKVIINNYSGERTLNDFSIRNTIVIPNCYINFHTDIPERTNKPIEIITVARFTKQKDFDTALKSVGFLRERGIDFRYTIIGYGTEENNIRTTISALNLTDNVTLIIDPKDIFSYLLKADIYLSTSLYEGTSNSIMEALDAELPIVATNVGDNDILVKNAQNGYIHEIGDSSGIGNSLYKLAVNKTLRILFGRKSKQILINNYSFEKFKNSYLSFLK